MKRQFVSVEPGGIYSLLLRRRGSPIPRYRIPLEESDLNTKKKIKREQGSRFQHWSGARQRDRVVLSRQYTDADMINRLIDLAASLHKGWHIGLTDYPEEIEFSFADEIAAVEFRLRVDDELGVDPLHQIK